MKRKNKLGILLFLAIILILGIGFIATKPQKVWLVRKIN